jgi:TPR repeat protein
MYNCGYCPEYGKGINQDFLRDAKYYHLSAEKNTASAENSFGMCLERGNGIHEGLVSGGTIL